MEVNIAHVHAQPRGIGVLLVLHNHGEAVQGLRKVAVGDSWCRGDS